MRKVKDNDLMRWYGRDLWTAREAACLFTEIEPASVSGEPRPDEPLWEQFESIKDLIRATHPGQNYRVMKRPPADWVAWAKESGAHVSEFVLNWQQTRQPPASPAAGETAGPNPLSPRAEATYLNIIAALLDVISVGIPDADHGAGMIGPALGYQSEAKLRAALAARYTGFGGLSQTTLGVKFAEAKKSLAS